MDLCVCICQLSDITLIVCTDYYYGDIHSAILEEVVFYSLFVANSFRTLNFQSLALFFVIFCQMLS